MKKIHILLSILVLLTTLSLSFNVFLINRVHKYNENVNDKEKIMLNLFE